MRGGRAECVPGRGSEDLETSKLSKTKRLTTVLQNEWRPRMSALLLKGPFVQGPALKAASDPSSSRAQTRAGKDVSTLRLEGQPWSRADLLGGCTARAHQPLPGRAPSQACP